MNPNVMRAMRLAMVAATAFGGSGLQPAFAQTNRPPEPKSRAVAIKPAKPQRNPCASYGAGFVRLEGSDTCVKIGGAVSVGGGFSR